MRDPREDPQPGDVISKTSQKGLTSTRTVIKRQDNDIYYTSTRKNSKECMCWITTWMDWARDAEVVTVAGIPDTPASKV